MTLEENYIRIVKVSGYINDAIFNLSKKDDLWQILLKFIMMIM